MNLNSVALNYKINVGAEGNPAYQIKIDLKISKILSRDLVQFGIYVEILS